jgi:hypothetical protein
MGMRSRFSVGSTGMLSSTLGSTGAARSGTEQTCGADQEERLKVRGWTLANFFDWNQLGGTLKSEEGGAAGGSWASRAEQPSVSAKKLRPIPSGLCHKQIAREMGKEALPDSPGGPGFVGRLTAAPAR